VGGYQRKDHTKTPQSEACVDAQHENIAPLYEYRNSRTLSRPEEAPRHSRGAFLMLFTVPSADLDNTRRFHQAEGPEHAVDASAAVQAPIFQEVSVDKRSNARGPKKLASVVQLQKLL
jgi:hypothetical protein